MNSLSLSFWWSLDAFHKSISFISQIVRLAICGLSDFALHRGFFSLVLPWYSGLLCLKAPTRECF